MPTVGSGKSAKKFPYSKSGEKAAKKYSKDSGKKLVYKPGKHD